MNKKRQLITSDEATPLASQPKKPCTDCPWSRGALRGWLGDLSCEEWIAAAHGEARIDCHVFAGPQCAGAAIYRANVAKLPRERSALVLPADRTAVFASPAEFCEHHEINGES